MRKALILFAGQVEKSDPRAPGELVWERPYWKHHLGNRFWSKPTRYFEQI